MAILSILNPFGWFGGGPAKLSGGNQPSAAGTASYAGKPVTPERALELAAYWACVKLKAQTIGTLPLKLYSLDAKRSRTEAFDHPLYDVLLHQPSADHSAVEFWEGVGACEAIWGNAFALKNTIGGRVVSLDLLRPYRMTVRRTASGEPIYDYDDEVRGHVEYGPDDVMVVRGFGLCDLTGLSAIAFARQAIGSAIAADEAAGALFRNGMRLSGWFRYKGMAGGNGGLLTKSQMEDTRDALIKPYSGSGNSGKAGILPGDFDWLATAMTPVEADLMNSRRMGVEEICRFHGVPPILVGHSAQGQTMWGTGVDAVILAWMTTGLRPILKRIEAAVMRDLIGRGDRQNLIAAFDTTELLRGDNKGQAEIDRTLVQGSISSINERRAERNLPPVENGDKIIVQGAMLPLADLGVVAKLPVDRPVAPGADVHADPTLAEGPDTKMLLAAFDMGRKFNPHHGSNGRFAAAGGEGGSGDPEDRPATNAESLAAGKHGISLVIKGIALVAIGSLAVALAPEAAPVMFLGAAAIGTANGMFIKAGVASAEIVLHGMGIPTKRIERLAGRIGDWFKSGPSDPELLQAIKPHLAEAADLALQEAVAAIDEKHASAPNRDVVVKALRDACAQYKARVDAL